GGRLHANELSRSRTEIYGEPAAACGDLEDPPSIDLELREDTRMNGLSLADGVPELRFELIYHRPAQGSTEPLGRICVAARGSFAFSGGDGSKVLGWQGRKLVEAVGLQAKRSRGSRLAVIQVSVG